MSKSKLREKFLSQKDRQISSLAEIVLDDESVEQVVFILPPERMVRDYQKKRERRLPDGTVILEPFVEEAEYEAGVLLHCVREPVVGKDGPVIGEDDRPLYGAPVFTAADKEVLMDASLHRLGGWRRRLLDQYGAFLAASAPDLVKEIERFMKKPTPEDDPDDAEGNDERE